MKSCDEILELISAALDGALDDSERLELETHLNACPQCSALLAELRGLQEAVGTPEEAPDGFARQVMAKIAAEPAQQKDTLPFPAKRVSHFPWKKWAVSAAVVTVVVFGAVALPGRFQLGSTNNASSSGSSNRNGANAPAYVEMDSLEESEMEMDLALGDFPILDPGDQFNSYSFQGQSELQIPMAGVTDYSLISDAEAAHQMTTDPAAYCGVFTLNGGPLPEGLEDYEFVEDEEGNISYVVPADYFFSNAAALKASNASNFAGLSSEDTVDPTAEYGLIIVELPE